MERLVEFFGICRALSHILPPRDKGIAGFRLLLQAEIGAEGSGGTMFNVVHRLSTIFGLPLSGLAGCRAATSVCVEQPTAAIVAEIRDSLTSRPAAFRASLIIRQGVYVDSITDESSLADSANALTLVAGRDRPGTYDVVVRRQGYATWTQEGVVARAVGACGGVEAVHVRVNLQPND